MQPNIPLTRALEGFRIHNQVANLSKLTVDWYTKRLAVLERFLQDLNGGSEINLNEITADDLRAFIANLQGRTMRFEQHTTRKPTSGGYAPVTIRGYTRAISAFCNWAHKEGLLRKRVHENLPHPKLPQVIKEIFTKQEIVALLRAAEAHADETLARRDRAIILMLLDTGIRASELCSLTLDRVDDQYRRLHITGKGMRDRYVILGSETREAVWKYVAIYRPNPATPFIQNIFLTNQHRAIDRCTLAHVLRNLGERAGVTNCHPHRFRHSAATFFYRNTNGNLFLTQQMLGHSSPLTTRIYAKTYTQDLELAHAKAGPVTNLLN